MQYITYHILHIQLTGLNLSLSKRSLKFAGGANFFELGIYNVSLRKMKSSIIKTPPIMVLT